MLDVTLAHDLDALLDALAEQIEAARAASGHGAFEPAHVVVPHLAMAAAVEIGLARRLGISANISTTSLARLLALAVEEAPTGGAGDAAVEADEAGGLEARVVDRDLVRRLLLDRLEDLLGPTDAPDELRAVREHMLEAGPGGVEVRRLALATRLSARFVEDALERPALHAAWRRGGSSLPPGSPDRATETWMRRLWLDALGPDGALARVNATTLTRSAARSSPRPGPPAEGGPAFASGDDDGALWLGPDAALSRAPRGAVPATLHVLSLGLDPRGHVDALTAIAARADVHLLALVPAPADSAGADGPARSGVRPAARALSSWAAPAAAAGVSWVERARATGGAVRVRDGALAPGDTRLGRLQGAVTGRTPARSEAAGGEDRVAPAGGEDADDVDRPAGPGPAVQAAGGEGRVPAAAARGIDPSLVLLAAPDARREVEVAAGEVLAALRASSSTARPLRMSDVAVAIAGPDPDAARARVATVFEAGHGLPVTFVDGPGRGEPSVVDAARRVIDLAAGELGHDSIRSLLVHGNVGGARAEDEDEVEAWTRWIASLGVVRGADAADLAGAWPGHEHATWEQALRRLVLGALAPDDAPVALGREEHLPHAPSGFAPASAARLVGLVRGLVTDALALRSARLSLTAWGALLARVVLAWVEPQDDGERETLERVAMALRGLADLDALDPAPDGASPSRATFASPQTTSSPSMPLPSCAAEPVMARTATDSATSGAPIASTGTAPTSAPAPSGSSTSSAPIASTGTAPTSTPAPSGSPTSSAPIASTGTAPWIAPSSSGSQGAPRSTASAPAGAARLHGFAVASALAQDALDRAGARRGHELTGGIVCGPLHALRGLPFRVILVLGLGEDRFPTPDVAGDLDLREAGPSGPTSRERDAGALLDVVLAARERLGLSYCARDPLSGDALEPSPLLGQLQRALVALGDPPPIARHPLRRSDPLLHPPPFGARGVGAVNALLPSEHGAAPGARAEARARAVGEAARRAGATDLTAARITLGLSPGAMPRTGRSVEDERPRERGSPGAMIERLSAGISARHPWIRTTQEVLGDVPRLACEVSWPPHTRYLQFTPCGIEAPREHEYGLLWGVSSQGRAPGDFDARTLGDLAYCLRCVDAWLVRGCAWEEFPPFALASSPASDRLSVARRSDAGARTDGGAPGEVRLSVSALQAFLVSPLQAWATHRLRLARGSGSAGEGEDGPGRDVLEPSPLEATLVLRDAFVEALTTGSRKGDPDLSGALERAWSARARRAVLAHAFPAPPLLAAVARRHEGALLAWRDRLDSWVGLTALRGLAPHGLGVGARRGGGPGAVPAGPVHAPLVLDLALDDAGARPTRVVITGRTGLLLPGLDRAIALATGSAGDAQVGRAVLDHALLVAAGLPPPSRFEVVVAAVKGRSWRVGLTPFDADSARAWLVRLVRDLLGGSHGYLLPLDATARWLRERRGAPPAAGDDAALASAIRRAQADPWRPTSDRFGPVDVAGHGVDAFGPPRGAAALARARLGPWLSREVSA